MTEQRQSQGFTLIELLIVVGILSIIIAIALPQYKFFIIKSKRTEAAILLKAAHASETAYFAAHGQYFPANVENNATGLGPPFFINADMGLPTGTTRLGWYFTTYVGYGSIGNKTLGYKVSVMNNVDDDGFLERFLIKSHHPTIPNTPECPDGVPIHLQVDAPSNSIYACPV